jgi:tRNA threonylcarbamoyladenosine modification (KEOPS) complex Cgi121 subunit
LGSLRRDKKETLRKIIQKQQLKRELNREVTKLVKAGLLKQLAEKTLKRRIKELEMLRYIEEYRKYLEITGYKNVAFDKAEAFLKANRKHTQQNVDIQFFDAELIATQEHLFFAVLNALQAFKNKTNLSKSHAVETILYASAQRQIQKAIERCGIKPQTESMAVVIIGKDPTQIQNVVKAVTESVGSKPNENVLEMTKTKLTKIKKAFEITDEELKILNNDNRKKAVVNLVIERVALLATQL